MDDKRTQRYRSLLGIKLHGYEFGTGLPLIILHGNTSNGRACALRPDLPSVTVANADHYVPEIQSTEIARLIIEFAVENHLT